LFAAEQRGRDLPGARLRVESQIPLSRGLGSSSSAIIAGLSVYETLTGDKLARQDLFDYALHFEGHGDNLAPSILGGLVVAVVRDYTVQAGIQRKSLLAVRREWPREVGVVICVPELELETSKMRAVLPEMISRSDAIFNLQRGALLQVAISERRFDLFSEALRDRIHQPYRAPLAPGLSEALTLNDETAEHPGLLGVAISGAGSTLIAFVLGDEGCRRAVGQALVGRLAGCAISSVAKEVEVDTQGRVITTSDFQPSS
ncbi:MAG: homoserine kinase, partial [Acidobacteria bacterium]|nr:homoserine kinase [Acidobacteriota bacterium]